MYTKYDTDLEKAYLRVITESKACCDQKPKIEKLEKAQPKPKVKTAAPTGKVIKEEEVAASVKAEPIISDSDLLEEDDVSLETECWCEELKESLQNIFDYGVEFNEDENILEVTKNPAEPNTPVAEIEMIKDNTVLITVLNAEDDCVQEFGLDEFTAIAEFITDCFESAPGDGVPTEDPYTGADIEESVEKVTEDTPEEKTNKLDELYKLIVAGRDLPLDLFATAPVLLQHLYVMKKGYKNITPEYLNACKPELKAHIEKETKSVVGEADFGKGWEGGSLKDASRKTAGVQTGMHSVGSSKIPNSGSGLLQKLMAEGKPIPVIEFAELSPEDQMAYISRIGYKVQPVTKAGKMYDYKAYMKPEVIDWFNDGSESGFKAMRDKWMAERQEALPAAKGKDFGTQVAEADEYNTPFQIVGNTKHYILYRIDSFAACKELGSKQFDICKDEKMWNAYYNRKDKRIYFIVMNREDTRWGREIFAVVVDKDNTYKAYDERNRENGNDLPIQSYYGNEVLELISKAKWYPVKEQESNEENVTEEGVKFGKGWLTGSLKDTARKTAIVSQGTPGTTTPSNFKNIKFDDIHKGKKKLSTSEFKELPSEKQMKYIINNKSIAKEYEEVMKPETRYYYKNNMR